MSALKSVVHSGLPATVLGVCLTVAVDSHYWKRQLWPEGEVFYFNVVENKSSDWGTSPWHWWVLGVRAWGHVLCLFGNRCLRLSLYMCVCTFESAKSGCRSPFQGVLTACTPPNRRYCLSALPRSLLGAMVLVPLGMPLPAMLKNRFTESAFPSSFGSPLALLSWSAVVFVALYSFLPHKELRFIFPALPVFNATAAVGSFLCLSLSHLPCLHAWCRHTSQYRLCATNTKAAYAYTDERARVS